jgi:hypothetical protein
MLAAAGQESGKVVAVLGYLAQASPLLPIVPSLVAQIMGLVATHLQPLFRGAEVEALAEDRRRVQAGPRHLVLVGEVAVAVVHLCRTTAAQAARPVISQAAQQARPQERSTAVQGFRAWARHRDLAAAAAHLTQRSRASAVQGAFPAAVAAVAVLRWLAAPQAQVAQALAAKSG